MAKPDYSSWFSKQQAADAIGVSTKTVEKLAADKELQRAYWKRPETGARTAVYHPGDVERIRLERNPDAGPFVLPAETSSPQAALTTQPGADLAQRFMDLLGRAADSENSEKYRRRDRVRITEKLYLTVPEAAELSGLPLAEIRRLIGAGRLEARKTGGGWRIRRTALEAL